MKWQKGRILSSRRGLQPSSMQTCIHLSSASCCTNLEGNSTLLSLSFRISKLEMLLPDLQDGCEVYIRQLHDVAEAGFKLQQFESSIHTFNGVKLNSSLSCSYVILIHKMWLQHIVSAQLIVVISMQNKHLFAFCNIWSKSVEMVNDRLWPNKAYMGAKVSLGGQVGSRWNCGRGGHGLQVG